MSVREPDGLFVPEAKVSNNYDQVGNGAYTSMYEEMPREDHKEFLKKVREAIEDAGLW
jgi:flavodoxin